MYVMLQHYSCQRYEINVENQFFLAHNQNGSSSRNVSKNPKYRDASTRTHPQVKPKGCDSHKQCYDDLALVKKIVLDSAEEMFNMKKVIFDIAAMLKEGKVRELIHPPLRAALLSPSVAQCPFGLNTKEGSGLWISRTYSTPGLLLFQFLPL